MSAATAPWASLFCLAFAATPAARGATPPPPGPPPRLVVTDLDTSRARGLGAGVGGDERPGDLGLFLGEQVRGVALRLLSQRFQVAPLLAVQPRLPPGARCVPACRAASAARAGGDVALVGAVHDAGAEVSVRLMAVRLPSRQPFAQATRTADDPVVAAVAAAEDLATLLLQVPEPAARPPQGSPPPPPPLPPPPPPRGFGGPSPLAALGLEFLLPSSGLFYARAPGAGALVLLGMGAGVGTTVMGFQRDSDTVTIVGVSLLLAARLGGLIAAPIMAARGGEGQERAAFAPPSPRPPQLAPVGAFASPPPPTAWSWAGTF